MRYCDTCIMPDTRPGSVFVGATCQACINYANRAKIDWERRWGELVNIANVEKAKSREFDCLIAVSGGKDSHFLVDLATKHLGLRPLLFRVGDGFGISKAGRENLINLTRYAPIIEYLPEKGIYRRLVRHYFEAEGNFPFVDRSIYTMPVKAALMHGIKLVLFGEDPAFEYGTTGQESPTAIPVLEKLFSSWQTIPGFSDRELAWLEPPFAHTIFKHGKVLPLFLSYYVPWSGLANLRVAKEMGFRELEYQRKGTIENWDSIDILGWQVSNWLKYLKFGYGRVTDIASRLIRDKAMTRESAIGLASLHDGEIDDAVLEDFLGTTGYSPDEFSAIAERWRNKKLFGKETTSGT